MTDWTDGMLPCADCQALTRDTVDGVPLCNDCEDERDIIAESVRRRTRGEPPSRFVAVDPVDRTSTSRERA